ncbi:MAG TPA: glycosyltransferase [Solirubrobacterales bacterium]|nr:glycosyltransferase [Solirubrobacterales bacterium]
MAAEPESGAAARTGPVAIVAARNEGDRIGATLAALRAALPGVELWVADDASSDDTRDVALASGATVIGRNRPHGKGGNVTAAATAALEGLAPDAVVVLCDGDLADTAGRLRPLVETVAAGEADLAIAAFERKVGGGLGLAKGYARWAIRRLSGLETMAPISGQRALRSRVLADLLPFAPRYGMEVGMTVDAVRAGYRVAEVELDLAHRASGKSLSGFIHRGRQLRDFTAVYRDRRRSGAATVK